MKIQYHNSLRKKRKKKVNMTLIAVRLFELRSLIHKIGADYYYIPGTDPHKNEYVPPCWQRRAWISNFTGSAGDVIIGIHEAFLWTDSRYFLQAEQQLDNSLYQLMKIGQCETPVAINEWLLQQHRPLVFATDPRLISIRQAERIKQVLQKNGGKLIAVEDNLIDQIWKDRPSIPKSPIRLQPQPYVGKSAEGKLAQLRKTLRSKNANAIVLNILDAIAWLFNIRGNDITYNPLVISYAIVTEKEAILFVDFDKITKEAKSKFEEISLQVKSYEAFSNALLQLSGSTLWIDPATTNWWTGNHLQNTINWVTQPSPITLAKAVKNLTEQQGAREAHIIDAIAMVKFLHWIETHWQKGITEITASEKLEAFRLEDSRCMGLSFSTISGFGAHSAIIHYSATQKTNSRIDDSSLYLIDSGGQYLAGTTDITRTIHLGTPTEEQKEHYTLVLKGHLAIRHAVFPKHTCGERIDVLARQFLWRKALDYGHGTGHGVGSYLCVHEGPQAITAHNTNIPLQPGMILSNEPGVYLTNKYGIRIENLCLVIKKFSIDDSRTQHGPFYAFEDLTLVPYCQKLIQAKALTREEMQQINDYHRQVYRTLKNLLPATKLIDWLKAATTPL